MSQFEAESTIKISTLSLNPLHNICATEKRSMKKNPDILEKIEGCLLCVSMYTRHSILQFVYS